MVDPKGPPTALGQPYSRTHLRPYTLGRLRGGHAHFPAKNMIFIQKRNQIVIGSSLLSSHKKFSPIDQKIAELWPKNVCTYME